MICSITGKVPDSPVFSRKSGLVFERFYVESYVHAHGRCPITRQRLTLNDLVSVTELEDSLSTGVTLAAKESECQDMPDCIAHDISTTSARLQNARLQNDRLKIPPSLSRTDALRKYTLLSSHKLHKTIMPGILSLDIVGSKDIIASGGADTNATVFDKVSGKVVSTLKGHSEKVTSVKFINEGELLVTGSADNTVRVWQPSEDGSYKCKRILTNHTAQVQAVTVHPSNKYFLSASLDCTWQFYDLTHDIHMARVANVTGSEGFTTAAFHPDGHILGTGTSRFVRFWDVARQDDIIKIDAHSGLVTSIAFSENGYLLATAAQDCVKLWDLRCFKSFMTFPSDDIYTLKHSVDFDHSGRYLAAGGKHLSIYNIGAAYKCEPVITFPDMSGIVDISCVKFGEDGKYIAAGTLDSKLLSIGLTEENNYMHEDNNSMEYENCLKDWMVESDYLTDIIL